MDTPNEIACAPAAARTHAWGAVARRLARLQTVETPLFVSVPIVPIAPIGPNPSADWEWVVARTLRAVLNCPKMIFNGAVLGNDSPRMAG